MNETTTQWHLGLKPAVDLELADERANLSYFRDFSLSQQALEIDLLIIRKKGNRPIQNEIGRFFKKYNIVEYKSPKDELNIDTFYKVTAYTCLYKAYGDTMDERRADEITMSLIRKAKPVKLFEYFEEHGIRLANPYEGVYYVKNGVLFPTQIIITKELDPHKHIWLTALSDGLQKQQLQALLEKTESYHAKLDRELAEAVLEVAIKANWQQAQELRGDGNMCEALMELMEPEINKIRETVREETTQQVTQQVTQQGIRNAVIALRVCGNGDIEIKNAIIKAYGISDSEAEGYL